MITTKSERVERIVKFLREEGFVPKVDGDGDVAFKVEGGSYFVTCEEDDNTFYRIIYPAFRMTEGDEERAKVTMAAFEATCGVKVAKIIIVGSDVWAIVDHFCSSVEEFCAVFPRNLMALRAAVHFFRKEMEAE